LHFEDPEEHKRLERLMYRDLKPEDCLEETLVDQMIQSFWLAERFKLRLSLRQDSIFEQLTPAKITDMLEIPEPYRSHPPPFLKEPSTKFTKKEVQLATARFGSYQHLHKNSKGIANYQMVFGAYQDLFTGLDAHIGDRYGVPILASTGKGLSTAWQNEPRKMEEVLLKYASYLYYQMHFEILRPQIRVWMSSWYFLQRRENYQDYLQDEQVVKELNRFQNTLNQLLKYRKAKADAKMHAVHDKAPNRGNKIPNSSSESSTS
jgi:hypothetical protein